MTITDNHGFIIGPITIKPVNQHDTTLLTEAFTELIAFANRIGMKLNAAALTLDSGFGSKVHHNIIKEQGLVPVIYPNRRNAKHLLSSLASSDGFAKISTKTAIK